MTARAERAVFKHLHDAHWFKGQATGDGNCAFHSLHTWSDNLRAVWDTLGWDTAKLSCLPPTAAAWRSQCVQMLHQWEDLLTEDRRWMNGARGWTSTSDTAGRDHADSAPPSEPLPSVHEFLYHSQWGLSQDGVWATMVVFAMAATVISGIEYPIRVYTLTEPPDGKPESPALTQEIQPTLLTNSALVAALRNHLKLDAENRARNIPNLRNQVRKSQAHSLMHLFNNTSSKDWFGRLINAALIQHGPGFHMCGIQLRPWEAVFANFPFGRHWQPCHPIAKEGLGQLCVQFDAALQQLQDTESRSVVYHLGCNWPVDQPDPLPCSGNRTVPSVANSSFHPALLSAWVRYQGNPLCITAGSPADMSAQTMTAVNSCKNSYPVQVSMHVQKSSLGSIGHDHKPALCHLSYDCHISSVLP